MAVSKSLQVHVRNTVCPKTAWDSLKSHFEFVSITQIVRVNRAFFAATMKEETDLIEHITHMTYLAEQLRELNEEVSSKKFAVVVLGSLPDSYDNFMTSLNARDANNFTWDEVKSALMEEYMKRKDKGDKYKTGAEDAYFVGGSSRGSSRHHDAYFVGGYGNRGGGFRGGRGGRGGGRIGQQQGNRNHENPPFHPRSANMQTIGGSRGGRGGGRVGTYQSFRNPKDCWNCGELGHISSQCQQRDESANVVTEGESKNERESKRVKLEEDLFLESDVALAVVSKNVQDRPCKDEWFVDSAASAHMTYDETVIFQYIKYDEPKKVFLGNDTWISSAGEGKVRLPIIDGDNEIFLALHKVLFVPELAKNLLSVKSMTQNGAQVIFDKENCIVVPPRDAPSFTIAKAVGNLYKINILKHQRDYANYSSLDKTCGITMYTNGGGDASEQIWHARFGHVNKRYIHDLVSKELTKGLSLKVSSKDVLDCEACTQGKMHRSSFPKQSQHRATKILELIHSDLCGPMQVNSTGGSRYMLTFTDDYSRYTHVYFLKKKSEVLQKFKDFVALAENMSGNHVEKLNIYTNNFKKFRTDNGGEYTSNEFQKYCSEKGIAREFTNPHTPEQNGVSERLNRTIMEAVRSMIFHADVPLFLWAEAISTAVYIHNRCPTAALKNTTPYECWFREKPDVSNLRVFGCVAYYLVPDAQRKKLDPKSRKAIFVGYPEGTKGYKLYDVITGSFVRSRNIKFYEDKFHSFDNDEGKIEPEKYIIFPLDGVNLDTNNFDKPSVTNSVEYEDTADNQAGDTNVETTRDALANVDLSGTTTEADPAQLINNDNNDCEINNDNNVLKT